MSTIESFGFYKTLLIVLLSGYFGLLLFAALFVNRLVFPIPARGYKDSDDIIKFPYDKKGNQVSMVYLPHASSSHLIFFHHGNGEDLSHTLPRIQAIRKAGFSVLAWDYPGYGTSDGKPTESLVFSIADTIFQSIPEQFGYAHKQIIHYGRSLGGGPAVWLAEKHTCGGIILEGSFTSIFRVGLTANILPWDIFNNIKRIPSISCPSLIIHGTDDRTVPFSHGQKLYEAAPDPKFFTWLDKGGHNGHLHDHADVYIASLRNFKEFLVNK